MRRACAPPRRRQRSSPPRGDDRLLHRVGAVAARRCDRLSLHAGDPTETEALGWLNAVVPAFGPFSDEEPFRGPDDLEAALARLLARNAPDGWCLVIAGAACPDDAPTIGVETTALPGLVADRSRALPAAYADAWIAFRARGWSVKVFHEGAVQLWRQEA